ncbi:SGNH hydrolase-type esterase domain-containing protein [Blakeslea trispora]|nr:SGNH hydrolase-type esterase domain-containing protein [Blakeslea trispora]
MHYKIDQLQPNQVLQRDPVSNGIRIIVDRENSVSFTSGGPYFLQNKGPFYVGDVWVMAGQSNMRGHGLYYNPFTQQDLREESSHPQLFLFNSSEEWQPFTRDPSHRLASSPRTVHHTLPDPTVRNPTLLTYRGASLTNGFANTYQMLHPNIPLGLIACAHGGTSLYDWRPTVNESDTSLYGAMIDKIKKNGNHIRGILWYQGESDATDPSFASHYAHTFKHWLSSVRTDLQNPNLPVVIVQIGPHRLDKPDMVDLWNIVQDQQCQLFGLTPYTAGITSIDADLDDRLHLSAKSLSVIGKRLAYAAEKASLGQGPRATPLPSCAYCETFTFDKLTIMTVVVKFKYLDTPWQLTQNQPVFGFSVAASRTNEPVGLLKAMMDDPEEGTVRLHLINPTKADLVIHYSLLAGPCNLVTTDGRALPAFYDFPVSND